MLKIRENLYSSVKSECPKCEAENDYVCPYSIQGEEITQKCEVCGHEYEIEVE